MMGGIGSVEIVLIFGVLFFHLILIAGFFAVLYYLIKTAVKQAILESRREQR